MIVEIILCVIILCLIAYKSFSIDCSYFEKNGISYVKPVPILGSFYKSVFRQESFREEFVKAYNQFKGEKVYGIFEGSRPVIVINDLELLKKITIKDFEHFKNHVPFVDVEDDAMFGNTLLLLKDEKWHDMRTTLSPAFTGSKMRLMLQLILDICERAVKHLELSIKNKPNSKNGIDFEMKDFFTLYTSDAIASTAFGLDVNSLEDKNNEFYKMGRKFTSVTTWDIIFFIFYDVFKKFCRFIGIKLGNKEFNNYFYRLVVDAMKYRKENNIVRQDMINMLIEAQTNPEKSHNREWTNMELVAQCAIFLFAGLESVSSTLCFATQELVENPDIQEKLRQEVDNFNEQLNGGPLTYEVIKQMKYMDMFISEVLRKWPPFIQMDRQCSKSYKIDEDDLKLNIKVGDGIWIPTIGYHLDENYFPDPHKFDPERFSEENKMNIKQMSYLPFGSGPRICIGSRLALIECKVILFNILKKKL